MGTTMTLPGKTVDIVRGKTITIEMKVTYGDEEIIMKNFKNMWDETRTCMYKKGDRSAVEFDCNDFEKRMKIMVIGSCDF